MTRPNNVRAILIPLLAWFCIDLIAPVSSWAACTGSSPSWTSTADLASLQACVNAATAGDTIAVTGNATWTSTLAVTRGVSLVGSGNPTITGRRILVYWTPNAAARAAHDTLTIRGFTFDGDDVSFEEVAYSGLLRVANAAGGYVRLVVRNNTIKNMQDSGRGIYIQGQIYGLASSNVFDRIPIALGAYGDDYNSWRTETQAYAVEENFYFEDNIIRFTSAFTSGHAGFMTSGQGGRVVVRYNTWDYTNVSAPGEFWDVHGLQSPPSGGTTGCANYSNMVAEYYGNKIVNQVNAYRWTQHRGGWLLMFYNTLAGTTSPYNGATQYFCNSCQAAGSFNQKVGNTYTWRNLANGSEKPLTVYSPGAPPFGCDSDPIVENRDFFNYEPAFSGAAGVGCGTLAARPSTCSPGVAYWATSQSCSDPSTMVGARPAEAISGTLYKCTAPNTWTAYYSPYQYPHPLSGPAPPRNVSIK